MPLPTYSELRNMAESEIIAKFDKEISPQYTPATEFYLNELFRRSQEKQATESSQQTNAVLRFTKWVAILTLIVTLATIINIVIAYDAYIFSIRLAVTKGGG